MTYILGASFSSYSGSSLLFFVISKNQVREVLNTEPGDGVIPYAYIEQLCWEKHWHIKNIPGSSFWFYLTNIEIIVLSLNEVLPISERKSILGI